MKGMNVRNAFVLLLLIMCCFLIANPASSAVSVKPTKTVINASPVSHVACTQPYALCDFSKCTPLKNDPTKALCGCAIEQGVSMGLTSCDNRTPVNIYRDSVKGWMIKKGAPFGQLTSTYSFINAAPSTDNLINPNSTPFGYNGTWWFKRCDTNAAWTDCTDAPCYIPPADPINDPLDADRSASDYAVCVCNMKKNQPGYFIVVQNNNDCSSKTICSDYIWSAGPSNTIEGGVGILANYLQKNPDPNQPYAMDYCPNCKDCPANPLSATPSVPKS